MNNNSLDKHLQRISQKINHQISGNEILKGQKLKFQAMEHRIIENGLGILSLDNSLKESVSFSLEMPKNAILFVFSKKGSFVLKSEIQETNAVISSGNQFGILAFPFENWSIDISLNSYSGIGFLYMSLKKVHDLFELDIEEKLDLRNISGSYRSRHFLSLKKFNPEIEISIRQLFDHDIKNDYARVYEKGKVLEFLTMYMDQSEKSDDKKSDCPVLIDNLEEEKIRRAEKILLSNMTDPPSIPELARIVGTNEMKLKNNFKKLYGNTIYGYLLDHRLNSARLIMDKGGVQVKDVAFQIGYANPSHFIAAFKKKFGLTPNTYLKRA